MKYFPVSLRVHGRKVAVIGGGRIAEQRVRGLLDCGASVTVISPGVSEVLRKLAEAGSIALMLRDYRAGDLSDAWLVLTATDDAAVNAAVWRDAGKQGMLVNVADDPSKCDFIMPAVVRRGDLTIAISTGGASPALAVRIKHRISAMIGFEYERLLSVLKQVRIRLRAVVADEGARKKLHYRIVDSNLLDWILRSGENVLGERIDAVIRDASRGLSEETGIVYIVGAGPGDPGLITMRGIDCIRRADVILHDRLIDRRLLDEARADAEVIDVGKRRGDQGRMQGFIHDTMVARARQGQMVCRLKGGDPFVFGRGGEEARALTGADIPFEIIPGVTSAIAAPASAGIPVTHRDAAHSFMVMTGSRADDATPDEWAGAASVIAGGGTVVVLMGLAYLATIVDRLTASGCPADTPAAVISRGTWPDEDVRTGTLRNIGTQAAGTVSPAVIVFGVTVGERAKLAAIRASIGSSTG